MILHGWRGGGPCCWPFRLLLDLDRARLRMRNFAKTRNLYFRASNISFAWDGYCLSRCFRECQAECIGRSVGRVRLGSPGRAPSNPSQARPTSNG